MLDDGYLNQIGIDYSEEAIDYVKHRLRKQGTEGFPATTSSSTAPSLRFEVMDATKLEVRWFFLLPCLHGQILLR